MVNPIVGPPGSVGAPGPVIGGGQYGLPTVNGIPCTPEKIGTCIGLIQSQS